MQINICITKTPLECFYTISISENGLGSINFGKTYDAKRPLKCHYPPPYNALFFTPSGPCVVIYLRNIFQQDALFFLNLFQ